MTKSINETADTKARPANTIHLPVSINEPPISNVIPPESQAPPMGFAAQIKQPQPVAEESKPTTRSGRRS